MQQHAESRKVTYCRRSHELLAGEKGFAVQRTKITDDAVWQRFQATLEVNMMHDLTKSILSAHSDLMNVANSVANNLQHLRSAGASEDKMMSALMY